MVALGSLHPDTSTSSTTPWGTPRGTTGRSRITCDVKVPNSIWCSVNLATLVLSLSEICELEQQMLFDDGNDHGNGKEPERKNSNGFNPDGTMTAKDIPSFDQNSNAHSRWSI